MSSSSGQSFRQEFDCQSWEDVLQKFEDDADSAFRHDGILWADLHFNSQPRHAFWDTVAAILCYQSQFQSAHESAWRIPMCGRDFYVLPTVLGASVIHAIEDLENLEQCLQGALRRLEHCFDNSRPHKIWTEVGSLYQWDAEVVTALHTAWGRPLAKDTTEKHTECSHASEIDDVFPRSMYVHNPFDLSTATEDAQIA